MAPIVVLDELAEKDDAIAQWARAHSGMFVQLEEDVQLAVGRVLKAHPSWINPNSLRNRADPFVVAVGMTRRIPVVTYEEANPNQKKPNIPLVCDHMGVERRTPIEFMRMHGLRFALS